MEKRSPRSLDQVFAAAGDHPVYTRNGAGRLQELLRRVPGHAEAIVATVDVIAETTIAKGATANEVVTCGTTREPVAGRKGYADGAASKVAKDPAAGESREVFVAVVLNVGPLALRREFGAT